ncbi:MAG: DNA-processing protein DprA [Planctomycetota bacterium]
MTGVDPLPWIRLNLVPGVGPILAARLLEAFDNNPAAIFAANQTAMRRVKGIGAAIADELINREHARRAEAELDEATQHGIHIVTLADESYPPGLRAINDPPVVLYVRGELKPDDALAVGIVGTRHPNYYGRDQSHRFAELLARAGFTIVSGFAAGIDTAAHRGAIAAHGRTVAVLGSGLLDIYPAENAGMVPEVEAAGALITEYSLHTAPSTGTFPRRNRIIAGMSLGTLVVQADRKSGAMITAQFAMEYGREVFAIPGPIDQNRHTGCHFLIRSGATLVERLEDILEQLGPIQDHITTPDAARQARQRELFGATADAPSTAPAPSGPPPNLSPDETAVWNALGSEPLSVDALAGQAGLPVHRVVSALTLLELKGAARQLAGRHYTRR